MPGSESTSASQVKMSMWGVSAPHNSKLSHGASFQVSGKIPEKRYISQEVAFQELWLCRHNW